MRRVHWLHAVAGLWLVADGLAGIWLVLHRGLVLYTAGDCMPPPGYTGGGYHCYTVGHPHLWVGVLVLIVAIVGTVILFRVGTNLMAGRTVAGYPRA
jgi:hypothetical protein